jgi:hypothetical protein
MTKPRDLADLINTIDTDSTGRFLIGDSTTDALGAESGSVTISTGNSGVSTINAAHDDLIVEGSGDTGIVILSPDANKSQLRFGSPGDTAAAVLRWEYGTAGATVEFEMGSATTGADTFIMGGNANRSIGVFSQGHTIIGDTTSDVLPVDDGLVVSTGNSGATTAPTGADDLIVEGSGSTGITVLCPDLSIATVKLGTPTDTGGAHIKWDYTNKLCSVGAITPSGETVLIYDNGTQGAIVDSTGRFVVGTASDALGAEAGAVTISTGNSGATTASVDSDDFIIESAGNTGMTIFSPNTGFGQFKFGDPDDASVGAINYSHSVNAMTFKANAIQTLRFDSTGRSLFGSTTPDAVGAEAGSVTISTGDSGSSAPAPGADDLVIESDGEAGITIATPATSTGNIYFGDASVGKVGYISYDHNVNELIVGSDATEILRIVDSGIRIVQGYDTAVAQEGLTPFYQLHRTASSKPSFATVHWSSSGGSTHTGGYTMARSNSDTEETYTAVVDNLVIGQIRWAGSDGTQFQNGAEIEATAKGTWTATSNPCEINFSTCDVNEFALVERMKLTPPGRLVVGSVDSDALGSVVGITISSGDSGVSSVSGVADEFVIEHATSNGGMSILTANNLASNIIFGDPDNNAIGRINYAHSTDRMLFTAGGQASLQILSDGSLNVSGVTNYETLVTADDDIPNKKYVDDRYSFLVTAEENVALDTATNSGFQWSFGNGATNQYGVALPVACEVTHLTLCEKANTAITATVQLVKNGVAVSGATVSVSAAASGTQTLGTPVSFSAGDRLSFVTSSGTAQGAGGVVSALCRST